MWPITLAAAALAAVVFAVLLLIVIGGEEPDEWATFEVTSACELGVRDDRGDQLAECGGTLLRSGEAAPVLASLVLPSDGLLRSDPVDAVAVGDSLEVYEVPTEPNQVFRRADHRINHLALAAIDAALIALVPAAVVLVVVWVVERWPWGRRRERLIQGLRRFGLFLVAPLAIAVGLFLVAGPFFGRSPHL